MTKTDVLKSLYLYYAPASPLLVFGLCVGLPGQAQAGDANALPQDPSVAAGNASFAQSGKTLTVNQSSDRVIIDWRSFDIGANAQTSFNQPNTGSIAVNRINSGTDPTKIDGRLNGNGQVWILNPNGVLFGKTARVNAAGIVASTANIDTMRFMAGDNSLAFTGKDNGAVANEGHISVGESGLAAFVAPSVRNSGVITARTGKVTLAAGTTFTLDLAGDHLIEIGLGSDKAVTDQSGTIVDPGGTVQLSARAASEVVDGVINMSGVTRTASARRAGGDIILEGDKIAMSGTADASGTSGGTITMAAKTIDVADTANLNADARSSGDGGTITAVASLRGSYAGHYSVQAGAAGGDGGKIETSGETVVTAPDITVDASSAKGKAGEWLIDPLNVTIAAGSGGGLSGATVTAGAIQSTLAGGTSVAITTAQSGSDAGDLTLATTINATSTGNAGLTLMGRHLLATGNNVINLSGGALTLNVNSVNANSTPPTGGWVNDALAMIGTVGGGTTINLGAGTYTTSSGYINVNKSNITINGAGQGLTILDSRNASTYGLRVTALNNVTLNGFTLYGATRTNAYGLKAEATTNLTLTNITSQGAAKSEFDLNGIIGGTLDRLTANGASANGANFTSGASTPGNGISLTDSQNITLTNSTTLNNQWGGLALYQSNFATGYPFQEKNITVAASNNFTEANPIYSEDQSSLNNFGALNLVGYNYVVQSPGSPSDVYSWFQKTQQAAIDYAANTGSNATVQGWTGAATNNHFEVGIGSLAGGGSRALSIQAALNAAQPGAIIDIASGTYAESPTQNIPATMNFGTVSLGGSYSLSGGAANSFLSGTLSATAVNLAAPVGLGGALSLNTSTARGAITTQAIDGGQDLTIQAGAGTISLGALGATTRLGAVTVSGSTTLTGGTYSAASLNFGNLLLAADTTLNATGAITTAAIDGNQALTIGASSASLGALGAATRLGAVTDLATTTLTGGTYNAASLSFGNLLLAADTSLNATGAISAAAIDGNQALTIGASSANLGALGAATRLGAVTDLATTTLAGSIYKASSLTFAGDVVLTGALTALDTSAAAGDITINGNLLGSTKGAQSVALNAGPGTGTAAQNGNILLQNVGTKALALGGMTISGDNFGAQTVNLAGDFHSTLIGDQVFSSHTLNAGGVVQSAVGGNASGPINAGGSVGLSVSGQLSGAIGGTNVNLNAGTIQGATVTATQDVTVSANTVAGSSLTGQTVNATAADFNTDINASSVTLSAGTITGSTITGSEEININAANVQGSNLTAPTVKAVATDSFSTNVNASSVALNAGTISGSTIIGSSDIAITAKSVQGSSLAAPTVTAAADSFNSTVTASSAAKITGIDVAGTFSGGSFTVRGTNSVSANVAATSASVSGKAISGTYTGSSIALSGSGSVNATVVSDTLSVQTPSGNLQGTWNTADTGSSGTLVLNHQTSLGNGDVGPSQLVVENFAMPKGSSVTARGDIVLPQNLLLGLLSPAGQNAPAFVVVQDVRQLGTLLSQNYSAIVLDLAGTLRKDAPTD